MLAPVLAAAASLGIEVSHWSVEQMRMQRAADAAAIAGAIDYSKTANTQNAITAATDLAKINGAASTNVQVVSGVRNASDMALKVTASESIPLTLSRIFSSRASVTVTASSTAELLNGGTGTSTGAQPCIFAIRSAEDGGSGVGATGYINVNASGCSVRSNAGISFAGGGTFDTAGLYAAGSVTIPNWVTISGGEYPNDGQITDPYLADTALQTALTDAGDDGGPDIICYNQNCGLPSSPDTTFHGSYCDGQGTGTVTCYLKPGDYGNFTALGGGPYYYNFAPGLYVFHGNIDLENYTVSNGSDVTIILTGYFKGSNTFDFSLSAPSTAQAALTGGIPGVVLAGTTSGTVSLSGNPQFLAQGVVYFPNATFDASNSPTLGGSASSCLEILAANIVMSGDTYVRSSCSSLDTRTFGSVPGSPTYTAALVQ